MHGTEYRLSKWLAIFGTNYIDSYHVWNTYHVPSTGLSA